MPRGRPRKTPEPQPARWEHDPSGPRVDSAGEPPQVCRSLVSALAPYLGPSQARQACEQAAVEHERALKVAPAPQPALAARGELLADVLGWLLRQHVSYYRRLRPAYDALVSAYPPREALPEPQREREEQPDPRAVAARESFAAYVHLMWPGFELRPITKYLIAKFEQAVAEWEAGKKVFKLFIVPPRCGKTELISRKGAPWIVGRNPERALLALSLSQSFASDIGESVLDDMSSEEYAAVFPGVRLAKRSKSKKDFKIESDHPDLPEEAEELTVESVGSPGGLGGADRVGRVGAKDFAARSVVGHVVASRPAAQPAAPGDELEGDEGAAAAGELKPPGRGRRKRGRYVSYGVGGRFTGRDADGLLCDDLVDERDGDKETAMAKAHRAVRALRNRLNPSGRWFWFNVMTRDSEDDVAGYILRTFTRDGPIDVVEVPLVAEEDTYIEVPHTQSGFGGTWFRPKGDVLAPYSREEAESRHAELMQEAPHEWESRYMCRPVSRKGNMVDPAWLRLYTVEPFDRRRYARIVVSMDTGEGKSLDAARTAIGVYGEPLPVWNRCGGCGGSGLQEGFNQALTVIGSGPTHGPPQSVKLACPECLGTGHGAPVRVLEVAAFPWQQPDQVLVVKAICGRWGPTVVLIEDKSTGSSVAQQLRRDRDWRCTPVQLIEPCGNKTVRMAAASPSLKAGDYALPGDARAVQPSWTGVGYERGKDWALELRSQLQHFPKGRYKDLGDQLSQHVNWRVANALPAGVERLPAAGERPRVGAAELSRRVAAAINGPAFSAF